ncbi:unnamed protein product [Cylindrotheca closterium]|uniref:sn-1-specific diacylglycerol lipase n=1 Tax=Cylindrotheca closterium TaxID=2856 RepID=A0AAD2FTH8_9STRA|nr:unnamed protein product [Cylindrotheca closterium]
MTSMAKTMMRIRPSPRRMFFFIVNFHRLLLLLLLLSITVSVSGVDTQPTLSLPPPTSHFNINNNGLDADNHKEQPHNNKKKKKKQDGIFLQLQHKIIEGVSLSLQNHRPLLRTSNCDTPTVSSSSSSFWRPDDADCLLRKLRGGGGSRNEAVAMNAIAPTTTTAEKNNNTTTTTTTTTTTSTSPPPPPPLSAKWMDQQARSIALALIWVVLAQTLGTAVHACRTQVFEFASRFVKQDTLSAARSIRQMLDTMDDHGIVDLLQHHEPKQILLSIFALSKLQAACQFHQRHSGGGAGVLSQKRRRKATPASPLQEEMTNVDLELLQDLYDCLPFATAVYGWKFNLATSGKWHKGDMEALIKMTHVDPSDIVTVNWEARPNRPAFYIVRDRKRKRIVLAIRGTWSAQDLMTDLCCTTEDYLSASSSSSNSIFGGGKQQRLRAHSGMLTSARGVALLAEDVIAEELDNHADYSLLVVGHSMGGSAAAVLGTLWAERFQHANVTVYAYGPACVFPESFHDNYKGANIVSMLLDGDPFSCLSLGHVADVSGVLDYLCEDTDMRRLVVAHTEEPLKRIRSQDLEWCSRTMADIKRGLCLTEKLYPPGQLLFIHKKKSKYSKQADWSVHEVPPSFFQYWKLGPRMFDLTRHSPKVYETTLRKSIGRAKHHTTTNAKDNKQ